MASETKAAPPAPDVNSAKYKLGKIIDDHYRLVAEAKARGEKIGWSSSIFPQEIYQTLDVRVCYPENQAAAIGARRGGERMCTLAEGAGYSNDICAYARTSLAFTLGNEAPECPMPLPDFVLACNNICNCMTKWYENLGRILGIPVIYIDIPMNPEPEVNQETVEYVKGQFRYAIKQMEEITGKKWEEEKFKKIMEISNRSSRAWLKATKYSGCVPSPLNGFDLMNHMAVIVCARGTEDAVDAFETLAREYEENVKTGKSTFRGEEKYRIMWEGIACWPWLKATSSGLKDRGINMVATVYADTFGVFYDDFDGLCKGYCKVANCQCIEYARDNRIKIIRENKCDGGLIHNNRSCKPWSVFMPEMGRQIAEKCGIPVVSFDGDQADPRNFSEAQYDTRVQGLMEVMAENKNKGGK
jgi:benzoyl-CoA reductase/2-hydroxyglutaryl-CoA dehydratase subunit BcrC/BadD/HgdB